MKPFRPFVMLASAIALAFAFSGCAPQQPETTTPDTEQPAETPDAGETEGASVGMANLTFTPAQIEVAVGEEVTWTNDDSVPHTVTGDGFDSGTLQVGETFTRAFDSPGTYAYTCTIHPSMQGTVVVTE